MSLLLLSKSPAEVTVGTYPEDNQMHFSPTLWLYRDAGGGGGGSFGSIGTEGLVHVSKTGDIYTIEFKLETYPAYGSRKVTGQFIGKIQ
jgi:hypothetical protein